MTSSIRSKTFGVALIVAGTCIGAGMLALPVATAASGFVPASLAFCLTWVMMILSAFLMLEASLWFPEESNLVSMMKKTWGQYGALFTWIIYVLFLYALMTAYASGAAGIIGKGLGKLGFPESYGPGMLAFIFAIIVYLGTACVDWVNRLLMLGLLIAYLCLVFNIFPELSLTLLRDGQPKYLWSTGPLLVTSFGFHLTIPSLKHYLGGDVKHLRLAIFLGSFIPLLVYLIWEMLILGIIPIQGSDGLISILQGEAQSGKHAVIELTRILSDTLDNPQVTFFARLFGLCAILTSFIGVSLGLFDFFADGLNLQKTPKGKLLLAILTFLPPILIAVYCPSFIQALHYAGFFAAILLVIFPAIIVWKGRYYYAMSTNYQMRGGKPIIVLVCLFGLAVIAVEVLDHLHWLPVAVQEQAEFE